MKVTKYEVKALEVILSCMKHYILLEKVKDEYSKSELAQIKRSIHRLEVLKSKMEDSYLNE
jgi:hypothetical protein